MQIETENDIFKNKVNDSDVFIDEIQARNITLNDIVLSTGILFL